MSRNSRGASQRESLDSIVQRKTRELIAAKESYNSLVASAEREFDQLIDALREETVHVSMGLAKTCINAIRRKRALLPGAIDGLRQCYDPGEALEDEPESPQPYRHKSNSRHAKSVAPPEEEDGDELLKSDSQMSEDSAPNLNGLSLDAETYYKQYDHDDLDLNSFRDLNESA